MCFICLPAIVAAAASMYGAASAAHRPKRGSVPPCEYCRTADNEPGVNCRNCGAPQRVPTVLVNKQTFQDLCRELGVDAECDEVRKLRSPYGTGYSAIYDRMAAEWSGNTRL